MLCLRGDHVVNWHGECLHYDGCAVLTDWVGTLHYKLAPEREVGFSSWLTGNCHLIVMALLCLKVLSSNGRWSLSIGRSGFVTWSRHLNCLQTSLWIEWGVLYLTNNKPSHQQDILVAFPGLSVDWVMVHCTVCRTDSHNHLIQMSLRCFLVWPWSSRRIISIGMTAILHQDVLVVFSGLVLNWLEGILYLTDNNHDLFEMSVLCF